MFYTIYKTTNLINGKFYIGKHQTKDINDGYLGSGKLLKRAVKKYGLENFHKEILHVCESEKQMNALEKILVVPDSELNYNLCDGGKGGFNYIYKNKLYVKAGWNHTQESKNKISLNHSDVSGEKNPFYGKSLTEEHKKKLTFAGKKHSIETIEKLKEVGKSKTGTKSSQYGTCWITNGIENKKIKKETLDFYLNQGYYKGRIMQGELVW